MTEVFIREPKIGDKDEFIRKFYLAYAIMENDGKSHALRGELQAPKFHPNLSWTHYCVFRSKRTVIPV